MSDSFGKINSHNEWDHLREIIVGSAEGLNATIEWHSKKKNIRRNNESSL